MSWSVVDYVAELRRRSKRCYGRNEELEADLLKAFPLETAERISAPCVVVDCKGRILLWYLPGLLCLSRQVILKIFFSINND